GVLQFELRVIGGAQLTRLAQDVDAQLFLLRQVALGVQFAGKADEVVRLLADDAFEGAASQVIADPRRLAGLAIQGELLFEPLHGSCVAGCKLLRSGSRVIGLGADLCNYWNS